MRKKLPLSEIKEWKSNPRTMTAKRFEALKKSIQDDPELMEKFPIFVREKTMTIYSGHMRMKAVAELGWKEVTCEVDDISEKLANERAIKLNSHAGQWNNDELATLLDEMEKQGTDISTLGLDEQINKIIEQLNEKEIVEDEVPAVKKDPQTVLGDLWILGSHRLLCGDSTNVKSVERLMDGEKADMVYCDPPYGMSLDTDYSGIVGTSKSIGASRKIQGKKYDAVIGDDEEYDPSFVLQVFGATKEIFMWGGDYYSKFLPVGGWFVWDKCVTKDGMVSEGAERMIGSTFELCWSKEKHKRMIVRMFQRGFAGVDSSEKVHPTQKPIQLAAWFIERFSSEKQTVIDLYGGSGSTLIACEQLNRKCYMMELDSKYTDVIIQRYCNLTKNYDIIKNGQPYRWQTKS